MSLMREVVKDAAIGVAVATKPSDLKTLLRPGCAAAIWRRQPVYGFQSWIDGLDPAQLPRGRVVLRHETVRDALLHFCEISHTPMTPECKWLIDDVAALSDIFADLMKVRHVGLRLDAVATNACRKFHIDALTARLICTYRGMGTQYGISPDGNDPKRVFTVPTGSPILMRGTQWPEQPRTGLLHRSPPIEGTGETRLVLVIDPVFDPEDAL